MVSNIVQMRITPAVAKKRIAELAKDSSRVVYSDHGKMRRGKRNITRKQVINCLRHGFFTEQPYFNVIHGGYKFTMQTKDAGVLINVAAALHRADNGDYVVVVTTF